MTPKSMRFQAEIRAGSKGAAYVEIPFDVHEAFGTRGPVAVRAMFDGARYRASIDPAAGGRHVLDVRREIREAIGKDVGDTVHVVVEPEAGSPGAAR
ncbi:MAG TPA: DUF1905 domain-containing protein [Gemmatimonadota bacterium]|nr:DUF1905 domain-containing protein [Gemmatimonadota bacterium]